MLAIQGEFQAEAPADIRAGRLILDLFDKEVPRTCENFRCLCTGERGLGKSSKKPLHFKVARLTIMCTSKLQLLSQQCRLSVTCMCACVQGCRFHRIVKGFVCQGGDIVRGVPAQHDQQYHHVTLAGITKIQNLTLSRRRWVWRRQHLWRQVQ